MVFITAPREDYAVDAIRAGADYLLLHPYRPEDIADIIGRARLLCRRLQSHVRIRTFGEFEILVDEQPVHFQLSKARELLALCVAFNGQDVSIHTIVDHLWADNERANTSNTNYRSVIKCAADTLAALHAGHILVRKRGFCAIARTEVDCDFFDLMDGKPGSALAYNGVFLPRYSWAEDYIYSLNERKIALQSR